MKNKFMIYSSVVLGIALSTSVIAKFQVTHTAQVKSAVLSENGQSVVEFEEGRTLSRVAIWPEQREKLMLAKTETKAKTESSTSTAPKYIASRGGSVTVKTSTPAAGSVELLDWWKSARNVFSTGTVATVTDVYTGKTFKIKRTMGTNHADCEALTANDAAIIKGIWGGFSWDVRPIIVNVGGRRLAASMSSLPHAGVDSAPAFAYVDNRSEGYGSGENLDVIKGNGMNGHFDVHFLNSTRHKDGQVDPRHQAAIKVAAKK